MRFAQLASTTTLDAYLPARADAAGTATVKNTSGGTLGTLTPALDAVDTTLSSLAAAGAGTLAVTSATGITVGRRYLVGGAEATGGEFVTVKSLSGTTVTLVRPLRRAQASGAAFQGTRVTFPLTATHTPSPARNCRVEWSWDVSTVAQTPFVLPFDCTRFTPVSYLSMADVLDDDPALAKRIPEGTWLPAVSARAWDLVCARIAQKADPGGFVGSIDLTHAHSYWFRALLAETAGEEWTAYRDDMRARSRQELEAALAAAAYDAAQDGSARTGAGFRRGLAMLRSG